MLWCFGMAVCISGTKENPTIEIGKTSGFWTYEEARQWKEQKEDTKQEAGFTYTFTLWGENPGAMVENEELGRQSVLNVIELYGDFDLLSCSQEGGMMGENEQGEVPTLKQEDKNGCLLDQKTADLLFGNQNAVGCQLQYEGRKLKVRGILKQSEPVLIVQTKKQQTGGIINKSEKIDGTVSAEKLNRISLKLPAGKDAEETANEFMRNYNIDGQVIKITWFENLENFFCALFPLILLAGLWKEYRGTLRKAKRNSKIFFVMILFFIFISLGFWKLTGLKFSWPQSMIPTKWSDFSFWETFWENMKTQFSFLEAAGKSSLEIVKIKKCMLTMEFSLGAILLLPFTIYRKNNCGMRDAIIATVVSFCVFFFIILKYQQGAAVLAERKELWFLFPVFIALRAGRKGFDQLEKQGAAIIVSMFQFLDKIFVKKS